MDSSFFWGGGVRVRGWRMERGREIFCEGGEEVGWVWFGLVVYRILFSIVVVAVVGLGK